MNPPCPSLTPAKSRPRGNIRVQLIALTVLCLSIALLLSSYRSLSRQFDGLVIHKATEDALPPQFWANIAPSDEATSLATWTAEHIDNLVNQGNARRVGVSGVVYEKLHFGSRLQKSSFSPLVVVDGDSFLDQGVIWGILALMGVVASVFVWRATKAEMPDRHEPRAENGLESFLDD